MLRLAGCSSGTGVCARGGLAAGGYGSGAAGKNSSNLASLGHLPLQEGTWAVSITRHVLRSAYIGCAFLLERFALGSHLLFDAQRQTDRLAGGCVSIPPWVGIAARAFLSVVRLSGFASSLRDCALSYGDPDGVRGYGVGGAVEYVFA